MLSGLSSLLHAKLCLAQMLSKYKMINLPGSINHYTIFKLPVTFSMLFSTQQVWLDTPSFSLSVFQWSLCFHQNRDLSNWFWTHQIEGLDVSHYMYFLPQLYKLTDFIFKPWVQYVLVDCPSKKNASSSRFSHCPKTTCLTRRSWWIGRQNIRL